MAVFYDKTSTDELAKNNLIQIGENGIVSRYYVEKKMNKNPIKQTCWRWIFEMRFTDLNTGHWGEGGGDVFCFISDYEVNGQKFCSVRKKCLNDTNVKLPNEYLYSNFFTSNPCYFFMGRPDRI